jgi:polar amino acid transport system substrate-binding protein
MKKTWKNTLKKLAAGTLAASAILTLAACGKDSSAKAASDFAYVKDKGTLVVGVTRFEPMDYMDGEEWVGFDADLAKAFAEDLGVSVEFQEINWESKEVELQAKTIDCIWNGLTWSEDRAKQMGLTGAYLTNKQCLVVTPELGQKVKTIEDLKGLQIAAESGSAGESYVQENLTDVNYIEKTAQIDCLTELKMGTIDACVIDLIMAEYLTNKDGSNFQGLVPLPDVLDSATENYVVAFRQDSDLVDKADSFFEAKREDGSLKALAERYKLSQALPQ